MFTIGHSRHALPAFLALLRRHGVTAVADVRSAPYSRFNPQFNRASLSDALDEGGIRYAYLGDTLGGRPDDPACYEDGRIRYERVAATEHFKRGLARLVRGAAEHRIALMCAEQEPLDCHRTLLVARALDERGLEVRHIHGDGALETHEQAMDRLLDNAKLPQQDLYQRRDELIALAVAARQRRVGQTIEPIRPTRENSS